MSTNAQGTYYEGRDAFENGLDPDDNPYNEGNLRYDEWLCGYVDADALEAGENE